MKKHRSLLVLLLWSIVALMGCGSNPASTDANGVPTKLLIGTFAGDKPGQTKELFEPYRKYLEHKLGIPVEFYFATDYSAVIEAMRAKKLHMAYLTPFAYVLASRKPGLLPIATIGLNGSPCLYHSIIFTNTHTGLKTMDDVKTQAKNLTLCFADPASTSGHLIPRAYLKSIGLNPEESFKEPAIFAGSHAASILSVKAGKIDVGCSTSDLALNKLIREGNVKPGEIVTLWTSPPIVNDAVVVRNDLNKAFIKKLTQCYLNAAKDDNKAFSSFMKIYYTDTRNMSYIPAPDSLYDNLRKIAANTKELKLN